MLASFTFVKSDVEKQTPKAILFELGRNDSVWMPKSSISIFKKDGGFVMTMPIWLAKQKGFWGFNCWNEPIAPLVEESEIVNAVTNQGWVQIH